MLDFEALQKFSAVTALLKEIYRNDLQMIASTPHSVTYKLCGGTNYLKLVWDRDGMDMLVFTPKGGVLTDLWNWDRFWVYWDDPKRVGKDRKKFWARSLTYHGGMFASEYRFPFSNLGINTLSSLIGFTVRRSNSMIEDNRQAVLAKGPRQPSEATRAALASLRTDRTVTDQGQDDTLHTNTEDVVWALPANIPSDDLKWAFSF